MEDLNSNEKAQLETDDNECKVVVEDKEAKEGEIKAATNREKDACWGSIGSQSLILILVAIVCSIYFLVLSRFT